MQAEESAEERGRAEVRAPQQGAFKGAPQQGASTKGAPQQGAFKGTPQQGVSTTGAPQRGAMTTGALQRGAMGAPQQGAKTKGAPQQGASTTPAAARVTKRLASAISKAGQRATATMGATATRAGATMAEVARASMALASTALSQAVDGQAKRRRARAERCELRGSWWPPVTAETVAEPGANAPGLAAPDPLHPAQYPRPTVWHTNIQYGPGQVQESAPLWCDSCTKPHHGRDVEPCSTYGCHRRTCLLFTSAHPGGMTRLAVDRAFRRCSTCYSNMSG
jgi:hypothetical protein